MHHLTDKDLLLLWENALDRPLVEKGLLMLTFSHPESDPAQLASLSIGDRDARLLQVRENMFGSRLSNTAACPQCSQKVEWEMPLATLKVQPLSESGETRILELPFDNRILRLRLPNSADLMQITRYHDLETQTRSLIHNCLLHSDLPGEQFEPSAELIHAFSQLISENDPQADVSINLHCPECSYEWSAVFDIVQYLWLEIQERALRLLQDIYVLANKFGWSENDILSMNRRRRSFYLNMISK